MTESDAVEIPAPAAPRRRRWPFVLALGLLLAAGILFWFEPHKLFIDDEVNEPLPVAAEAETPSTAPAEETPSPETTPSTTPVGPRELVRGDFVSRDHDTSGVARVLDLGNGRRVVRVETLDTDNGPDLYLYLTTNPASGDEGGFDDDYVNLGQLKGNQGDQNYELDADVDISRYATVVIWCDRFDSAFGAADLTPA